MGNSHSHNRHTDTTYERTRSLKHHRSAPLLKRNFIHSASTLSFSLEPSQDTYLRPFSEKAALAANERVYHSPAPVSPPVYIPSPTSGLVTSASAPSQSQDPVEAAAHAAFLQAYPEY
ncbi:hypothetical protein EW146_g2621, partial [Bondarzewia mesenterica]